MFTLILLPSPTTFRTGIIDLGSHALQCNTVLSCAERTPLKSTCCHALQCNTVLSCITMPARCDGITKQSRFRIPMTMLLITSATQFLLCGNRSTTYYVLFSHRATCFQAKAQHGATASPTERGCGHHETPQRYCAPVLRDHDELEIDLRRYVRDPG